MAKPSELQEIPLDKKVLLSVYEAAALFGIGINRITNIISDNNCEFVVKIGNRRKIKRTKFEEYINEHNII